MQFKNFVPPPTIILGKKIHKTGCKLKHLGKRIASTSKFNLKVTTDSSISDKSSGNQLMKITTMLLKASGYIFLVFFQVSSITRVFSDFMRVI